ncbi:glycoside hydrolase family 127 protein [Poriferisphaera sp. WC338]|uniref:glycoside hydrolase family 127 protein n=1 Tax=Poriferisphaera sp. WC338 TaxID=3425129 RepID=UPI003D818227
MLEIRKLLFTGLVIGGCGLLASQFASAESSIAKEQARADYPLAPIEFHEVTLNDDFWLPRLKIQREVLVPHSLKEAQVGIDHVLAAAKFHMGQDVSYHHPHPFVDSDLYKVMEGVAYLLKLKRDPKLERQMDKIIKIIEAAQRDDGYLYPSHITGASQRHPHGGMGNREYSYVDHSHELYNMGHLYEAAIAYYQATGKGSLLKVAEKNAKHINKVFFIGDENYNDGKPVNQAPGHEEIELALVKLSRVTGNKLYLDMAKQFIDIRGVTYRPTGGGTTSGEYGQQHLPVREQTEAVGHAVRATYLYAAMADVSAIAGDKTLIPALDSIWSDIVNTRMGITGSLGAVHGIEGFGPQYDLPNKEAYNETCSAIGNVLVNYRMFLLKKDARYLDVAEVSLYNNSLAGVSLKGDTFFYVNPLATDGHYAFNHGHKTRAAWFGTACCPSNIARLVPQFSGMMYANDDQNLYLTFYAGSQTDAVINGTNVSLEQTTQYPLDGNVKLEVSPEKQTKFSIHMRIPTWAGNKQFVPGELYSFANHSSDQVVLTVNGSPVDYATEKGFAVIDREWESGDVVELNLPMPVRSNKTIDLVAANRDRVAFTRGPLVMCAEEIDNDDRSVNRFFFDDISTFANTSAKVKRIADGHDTVFVELATDEVIDDDGNAKSGNVTLIPYYAWNNRGVGSMTVWMPEKQSMAYPEETPMGKDSPFKRIDASHTWQLDGVIGIGDGRVPSHSDDHSIPRWTSWPEKGKSQWIECELKKAREIESISLYFYDDRPSGGECAVPKSWSLEVHEGGKWKPFDLYITDAYGTKASQFNLVHPGTPLVTKKFRINLEAQRDFAMGLLEVDVKFVD